MNAHENEMPADIRELADRLAQAGASTRASGENAAYRVALRTSHLLRDRTGVTPQWGRGAVRFWMWLAAPATALAGVVLALTIMRGGPGMSPGGGGVMATNLESDIETWLALDEMLREESFENSLAVLSLDAAGVATRSDEVDSLPRLESGS